MAPFGTDGRLRHQVELGQLGHPVPINGQAVELVAPAPGLRPAPFAAGRHQLIGDKQRPFAFNALELGQLFALVVEPRVVLNHGLVTIAVEALVAIGAAQLLADLLAGALHQRRVLHRPSRVADHR